MGGWLTLVIATAECLRVPWTVNNQIRGSDLCMRTIVHASVPWVHVRRYRRLFAVLIVVARRSLHRPVLSMRFELRDWGLRGVNIDESGCVGRCVFAAQELREVPHLLLSLIADLLAVGFWRLEVVA